MCVSTLYALPTPLWQAVIMDLRMLQELQHHTFVQAPFAARILHQALIAYLIHTKAQWKMFIYDTCVSMTLDIGYIGWLFACKTVGDKNSRHFWCCTLSQRWLTLLNNDCIECICFFLQYIAKLVISKNSALKIIYHWWV